jgi:beta-alanine--pyruvate transaminase
MCLAKGLTNAAVPMGAVAAARHVHDAIVEAPGDVPGIELFHGFTYTGHPLACAAALATLDLYAEDGLFERARSLEPFWEAAVHGLAGRRHVVDIRNFGLVAGIEMAPRAGAPGARGQELFRALFDAGYLVRATGDIIALSPPLIISEDEIADLVGALADALDALD